MKDKCSLTELCEKIDTDDVVCLAYKMYKKGRRDGYKEAIAAVKLMEKNSEVKQ